MALMTNECCIMWQHCVGTLFILGTKNLRESVLVLVLCGIFWRLKT